MNNKQNKTTLLRFGLLLCAPPLLLVGCQEYGYSSNLQVDVFHQQTRSSVDMLIVVDNSCSMVEEQDNLAQNFEALINTFASADVSWQLAVTTTDTEVERYRGLLMGGDDEIIVRGENGEIDRVEYDRDWDFVPGISLSLSADSYGSTTNDARDRWCNSVSEFSSGSLGSPGSWNPSCDGGAANNPEGGTDDGPRAPGAGDLVITEIMAESAGMDSWCEWFELTNVSDDTLELEGLTLYDLGRNEVTLPEYTVSPFAAVVIGRSDETNNNCGTPVDIVIDEGFTLADDTRVIDPETVDGAEIFSELVAQGTIGTGFEMGMEAARLSFEPEFYETHNQGWLREEANFSILFVSDEDDVSPYPVDDYLRYFSDLKGDRAYREEGVLNMSAVVGVNRPPRDDYPSCETENGFGWYGARYLKAASATGGLVESICAEDFAPMVTKLGLTLSGLEIDFYLSGVPDLGTLEVSLYETSENDSKLRDLRRDVDYTYVTDGNFLHFEETQVPPSDHYIVAEYVQLPDSATYNPDTEDGTE
jgi:hypothetical protein